MGRHATIRTKGGAKSPRGGHSQTKVPKAPKDATYDWVDDRGEVKPRCRFCKTVVPLAVWWSHKCPDPSAPPF